MSTTVTDERIRALAATAKPYSVALLHWGPERTMDGADAIELEHQRRMVSLRAEGVIAILCPVASDTVAACRDHDRAWPRKPRRSWPGTPACEPG